MNDDRRSPGRAAPRPAPRSRWGRWLRRVPSRTILIVAFVLAIVGAAIIALPFSTTSDQGVALDCGPPLYEVLVPADPAFDVAENTGCTEPAKTRVVLGSLVVGAAFLAALITQIGSRRSTRAQHGRWLRGPRPRARRRTAPKPAAKQSRVDGAGLELAERGRG